MPAIREFQPSTHAFRFPNYWPAGTPDIVVGTPIGNVSIGDAHNGLCGGMAFTVCDLYLARLQPPPDVNSSPGGTPLFNYMVSRLFSSFNIPGGVMTYYYWANTPDHDTVLGTRPGVGRMTVHDQLPQVLASIDKQQPATLGLVTIRSFNPGDLGECHQVLAYKYEWNGSRVTLGVYDPNRPGADDVTISLDTSNPTHTTPIDSNVDVRQPIRGFFYVGYSFIDPSSIAGPPWPQSAPPQPSRQGWAASDQGVLRTSDPPDVIYYVFEHAALAPGAVEYVLHNDTASGWRKEIRIPNGLIVADGHGSSAHNGNGVTELPGAEIVFRKAKAWGKMTDVLHLGQLDQMLPGDRVHFHWQQD